ncbi:MAG: hypothetical protein J6Q82_01630 [Clostridia bacterium]|nr:hypothetical protein [Clostridia bacterium]
MSGELWRICGLAVLCAAAVLILSRFGGEFVGPVRLAGGVLIFGVLILGVEEVLISLRDLFGDGSGSRYMELMLRALGLSFLTALCADLCRDCGESSIAGGVEMAGKLSIVTLCLPLVREILEMASAILALGE